MNPSLHISPHFLWHEALWLPQWGRHANAADGLSEAIIAELRKTFAIMEKLREFFAQPISVHCAYRPTNYNNLPTVNGAAFSPHIFGQACDFDVSGLSCDAVRMAILDQDLLVQYDVRMEDKPGSDWVHIDTREPEPGHKRFFIP